MSTVVLKLVIEGGDLFCEIDQARRVGVYLDNWALISIAKGSVELRDRFCNAVRYGGCLLFSVTNVYEIAGPQGASSAAVRGLLKGIGPFWIPIELNTYKVVERESSCIPGEAPVADGFINSYIATRVNDLFSHCDQLVDLSAESFFSLDAVLEWVYTKHIGLKGKACELADALRVLLSEARRQYELNPLSLDKYYPKVKLDLQRPAGYVFNHLMRQLVIEAKAYTFTNNDAMDFCHAVMAISYSRIAALDKQWRRRAESLPDYRRLASVFYLPQINDLIVTLERYIDRSIDKTI